MGFGPEGIVYVADLGDDYVLITDSREIDTILTNIGYDDAQCAYASLFVRVGDGEYLEVWGCARHVPLDETPLDQLL